MHAMKTKIIKWLPYSLLVLGLIVLGLFRIFPETMDTVYSGFIYKWVAQGISLVMSLIPFSMAELVCFAAVLLLLYGLICGYIIKHPKVLLRTIVYMAAVFLLTCGVNYYRVPLEKHLNYTLEPSSGDDLVELAENMLQRTNRAADMVRRTAEGKINPDYTFPQMKKEVLLAYDSLAVSVSGKFGGYFPAVKPLMVSNLYSYSYIMGFFFPWTVEANVNKSVPEFWIPGLIAHEQAHVRGFMRENEANFISYLVGCHTNNRELKYSTLLHSFIYVLSALQSSCPEAHRKIIEGLSPRVLHDLQENNEYISAHRSLWGEMSNKMNDVYLKVNGQDEGVKSYGKVVDLLLAEFKKNKSEMQQKANTSVYINEAPE